MNKPENYRTILQFKIILNDSKPRIWRRIIVPSNYTFFALHCAIQSAMGWGDGHLHAFYIKNQKKSSPITIEFPNPEGEDLFRGETLDERKETIVNYFGKTIRQCVYCYDFGDNWNHTILFERELPKDLEGVYPKCAAGKNACPPEDCGGVWGYFDLQKVINDPRHAEHQEMLEWLSINNSSEFKPKEFSIEEVEFVSPEKILARWNKTLQSK